MIEFNYLVNLFSTFWHVFPPFSTFFHLFPRGGHFSTWKSAKKHAKKWLLVIRGKYFFRYVMTFFVRERFLRLVAFSNSLSSRVLTVNFFLFSDFSRNLQENTYFPEYSGMYLIHSIERCAPVCRQLQRNFESPKLFFTYNST